MGDENEEPYDEWQHQWEIEAIKDEETYQMYVEKELLDEDRRNDK